MPTRQPTNTFVNDLADGFRQLSEAVRELLDDVRELSEAVREHCGLRVGLEETVLEFGFWFASVVHANVAQRCARRRGSLQKVT